MIVDVNTFIGDYPFRRIDGHEAAALAAGLHDDGVEEAWVSHLSGIFWRDPTEANELVAAAAAAHSTLRAVFAVHPERAHAPRVLRDALAAGAVAMRADPTFYGIDPAGAPMQRLAAMCGEADIPLLLAVRLEDGRQRHPHDVAGELPAAAVRTLLRADPRVRLLVTHADRPFIEEVHFGSTPAESARVWWDTSWVWGAPEDHLALLLETIGADRFVHGSGRPMRLPEAALARLDLLDVPADVLRALRSDNARRLGAR